MRPVLTWCHLRVSLSKGEPAPDELAAIAAAYLMLSSRAATPPPPRPSRWLLAGRAAQLDTDHARLAGRGASRWKAAARTSYARG